MNRNGYFSYLLLESNAAYLERASFYTDQRTEMIYTVAVLEGIISIHFLQGIVLGVAVAIAKALCSSRGLIV